MTRLLQGSVFPLKYGIAVRPKQGANSSSHSFLSALSVSLHHVFLATAFFVTLLLFKINNFKDAKEGEKWIFEKQRPNRVDKMFQLSTGRKSVSSSRTWMSPGADPLFLYIYFPLWLFCLLFPRYHQSGPRRDSCETETICEQRNKNRAFVNLGFSENKQLCCSLLSVF